MRILPRVVQTLITSTPDATRIRDGMTAAVQPTLDFLNTYFRSGADNTLQVLRGVTFLGRMVLSGGINGDVQIFNGNLIVRTRTGNGVVFIPTGGSPTFYCTNPQNTDAVFLVDAAGYTSAVSLSSRQGIKTQISCGEYWNTAPGANTNFAFQRTVSNTQNNGLGVTPFVMKWTHAGSIVGMTLNEAGPTAAQHQVIVQKNGSTIYTWVAGAGGNNATFWAAFAKGQLPFAAGDTMTVYGNVSTTSNTQQMLHFTLEMAA